jgi:transposase InsO family protein
MLEFLWSGSSQPPRADAAAALEGPAPAAGDDPGAAAGTPAPSSATSEVVDGSTPAGAEAPSTEAPAADDGPTAFGLARRLGRQRGRRLVKPAGPTPPLTAEQRLLLLDTWRRSGLPAANFAALVGLSRHTLYEWKRKFAAQGPGGLMDRPRGGARGSQLPDLTKRTIVMLKETNPSWGCQKISDMLARGPALPASASAVARVLHEAGYELEEVATHPHPDHVRRFERAKPNQLWQTDLFTFVLKRQNRRVYLVAFLDDHSRFLTGYGLHASQSSALVLEVLRAALLSYGTPEEILTDNGSQYVTWRGKSAFACQSLACTPDAGDSTDRNSPRRARLENDKAEDRFDDWCGATHDRITSGGRNRQSKMLPKQWPIALRLTSHHGTANSVRSSRRSNRTS